MFSCLLSPSVNRLDHWLAIQSGVLDTTYKMDAMLVCLCFRKNAKRTVLKLNPNARRFSLSSVYLCVCTAIVLVYQQTRRVPDSMYGLRSVNIITGSA